MRIKFTAKNIIKFFLLIILVLMFIFWQKTFSKAEEGIVVNVIDGDTIELDNGEIIRYIGVDTPETSPPLTPIECFGPEATEYNKSLVAGQKVILKRDLKNRDKLGRLLRYVYIDDTFINLKLVEEGYARTMQVSPNGSYAKLFSNAEDNAQNNKIGLWNESTCDGGR